MDALIAEKCEIIWQTHVHVRGDESRGTSVTHKRKFGRNVLYSPDKPAHPDKKKFNVATEPGQWTPFK